MNIKAGTLETLSWKPGEAEESLRKIHAYVHLEADRAINWYFDKKRVKAHASRLLRFAAIALTALGGLYPVITQVWPALPGAQSDGLLVSLFLGLAAALIGFDRLAGFSTGWIRYVLTATQIRKALAEFDMDWVALMAQNSPQPKPAEIERAIRRAKDFHLAVETFVLEETKAWVTEFESNLAQLEKEAKAQFESLKARREKEARDQEEAARAGAIDLTVDNAGQADGRAFAVKLAGAAGDVIEESVDGSDKWTALAVAPGRYKLTVEAVAGGRRVETSELVEVAPNAVAKVSVALPL